MCIGFLVGVVVWLVGVVVCCVLCVVVCRCGLGFGCGRGVACGVVWHAENPRVSIQNVPVCIGTTHTSVSTCARGAGIHGDVCNVHMEAFWMDTHGAGRGGEVVASSAYQKWPT